MKLDKVLFVGTGGGNDIFSCMLAADALWRMGWRWDEAMIAGVLSPFHHHTGVEVVDDDCELYVTGPNAKRFICRNDKSTQIGFVDAEVSKMVFARDGDALRLNIMGVCGLSLQKGSTGLAEVFKILAEEGAFTVLVDVGGDIFYRGKEDTHVLSPMFDSIVLRAFVDSAAPGILFEAGPGTDGEMDPEALEEALAKAQAVEHPLLVETVDKWEALYEKWIAPVRTGRTVPTTIQAYRSKEKILKLTYKARAHLGDTKIYHNFEQRINTELCKKFFLVEPRKISNPFAVDCDSPLDWFVATQVEQHQTNCEANLEYLQFGNRFHQFLTPSPLFPEDVRKWLTVKGFADFMQGVCDVIVMFTDDWQKISDTFSGSPISVCPFGAKLVFIEKKR
ncbi:MAG: hypothetical protein G01um101419_104 [Parcubacteria group bacterium Gr01-1014_19]|nr:MAG: hypothetical protein G01um101419_104 [Parcubacteria group bacterium Gr01-1014_19]